MRKGGIYISAKKRPTMISDVPRLIVQVMQTALRALEILPPDKLTTENIDAGGAAKGRFFLLVIAG